MTKLNITNKTIYKLKKNKNQSKKNVPKKRRYKKRKHKNGRSFRKRRRKYNIKNNSIKKYKKQRGGAGEIDTKTASIKKKEEELGKLNQQINLKRAKIKQINTVGLVEFEATAQEVAGKEEEKKKAIAVRLEAEKQKLDKAEDYHNYVDNEMKTHTVNKRHEKGHLLRLNNKIKNKME